MRTFLFLAAMLAAVGVATLALAQSAKSQRTVLGATPSGNQSVSCRANPRSINCLQPGQRIYTVIDNTTDDPGMSRGASPPVPCSANLLGIGIKCSTDTTYRSVPRHGYLSIMCAATDPGINYVDRADTEDSRMAAWQCRSIRQIVTVSGELSMCRGGLQVSHRSVCR